MLLLLSPGMCFEIGVELFLIDRDGFEERDVA